MTDTTNTTQQTVYTVTYVHLDYPDADCPDYDVTTVVCGTLNTAQQQLRLWAIEDLGGEGMDSCWLDNKLHYVTDNRETTPKQAAHMLDSGDTYYSRTGLSSQTMIYIEQQRMR